MKDKATLTLMELLIMVLVFSLAAALCLKAFVWSTQKTQENQVAAQAAMCVQTAAEELKGSRSAAEGSIYFDENWQQVSDGEGCYILTTKPFTDQMLGGAEISMTDRAGDALFSLSVCWQEDAA